MANKIVKYQLEAGRIPSWIDDGGYYPDPSEIIIGAPVVGYHQQIHLLILHLANTHPLPRHRLHADSKRLKRYQVAGS